MTIVVILCSAPSSSQETEKIKEFGENPGNLDMYLYIPGSIDMDIATEVPLVVALHGCSQTLNNLIEGSGWNQMAEKHKFIVLYPRQQFINNTSLCFNWFREDDFSEVGGESESITNMVEYVRENFKVDDEKIFLYGLSAGAAMGVSLLTNHPQTYNAGAIFAGAPYKIATNPFKAFSVMRNVPAKSIEEWGENIDNYRKDITYPRLIIFHGEDDNIVEIQSSVELIKQWKYLHHKDSLSVQEKEQFNNNEFVDRTSYLDEDLEEKIVFYRIRNLGHEIPIDQGTDQHQGGKEQTYSKDIDFYSTYYVLKDFGLITE